jgi:zinc transporter, ZIP family
MMAIGSDVPISAVAFTLTDGSFKRSFDPPVIGSVSCVIVQTAANITVSRRGARHRERF